MSYHCPSSRIHRASVGSRHRANCLRLTIHISSCSAGILETATGSKVRPRFIAISSFSIFPRRLISRDQKYDGLVPVAPKGQLVDGIVPALLIPILKLGDRLSPSRDARST